jgi:glucose/arabinose dehydrogenase
MTRPNAAALAAAIVVVGLGACTTSRQFAADDARQQRPGTQPASIAPESARHVPQAVAPKEFPRIPEPLLVHTGAFQPFGKRADDVRGEVKANSTVLRMDPDGSGLEVYAWGFRNPYGVQWSADGKLYVADNGFDERGSRPIGNAPDCLWIVKQGGWYGFPDFAGGVPVTDARFKPSRGAAPTMLLKEHPPVEKPWLTRPVHSAITKLAIAPRDGVATGGDVFVGEFGGGTPVTGPGASATGFDVLRIDPKTGEIAPFLRAKATALGPKGYEHSATAGPRHPLGVRFSRDGAALYVADFGAMAAFPAGAGPIVRPFSETGLIRRVTRDGGAAASGPPAGLSIVPGAAKVR